MAQTTAQSAESTAEKAQQQRSPLDQMQLIFSKSLEYVGMVFKESNTGDNRERAAGTSHKLKQMIPAANAQFHDALDELEAELMQARFVLREELAALRIKQAATTNGIHETLQSDEISDTEMPDASDTIQPLPSTEATSEEVVPSDDQLKHTEPSKPTQGLTIDTATVSNDDDPPELTTGGMSAMDFDSLFNDDPMGATVTASQSRNGSTPPGSTTPTIPASETVEEKPEPEPEPEPEPATDPIQDSPPRNNGCNNNNNNNDDEDLSSLLPGLESYANADNGAIDLSTPSPPAVDTISEIAPAAAATFAPAPAPQTLMVTAPNRIPNTTGGPQTGQVRDVMFDDLMDFADFDLGNFAVQDEEEPVDTGGETVFDESFFNVE